MDFQSIYNGRPDQREVGSSGYSNLLNLYNICTELQPELIIESGTWKGNSSWLFHHFADVICHDLQFDMLKWRSDTIKYIQEDISQWDYRDVPARTLFYFDDHISQRSRLEYLLSIGAKYAVFDDNQPFEIANRLKNPAWPTLQELVDDEDTLIGVFKAYKVMPFHEQNKKRFDTRLTYIEI